MPDDGFVPIPRPEAAEAVADLLAQAAATGVPCGPVRHLLPDVDAAYAAQDVGTRRAVAAGRRVVGAKIGLTSLAVQRQLGVGEPDFGVLFADMAAGEGLPIPMARLMQPRIEAEVALVLGRDLPHERPTVADVLLAVAYAVPALEIVGSRIAGWDIRIADTVADNASSGLYVLGGPARLLAGLDLGRAAAMRMRRIDGAGGDEVVSEGSGAACLGHPLNAAAWLAGEMARRARPLKAGDVVLTGALGSMVPVRPGDRFEAEIDGLGLVSAVFGDAP